MAQTRGTKHWSSLEQITKAFKYNKTIYPCKAAAHVGIGDREAGLQDGLLKDQVNGSLQPVLCVYGQLLHLLHQVLELLRGQLVEDAAEILQDLVSLELIAILLVGLLCTSPTRWLLHRRLPGLLSLVELHVVAERHAADDDFPGFFPLALLGATWPRGLKEKVVRKYNEKMF